MINCTRRVAFVRVSDCLLATAETRRLARRSGCGRDPASRVGAVVPRLPPGQSTSLYPELHRAVEDLLRSVLARRVRIRRLEIGLGRFVADQRQESLFPDRRDRLAQLCRSVDQVW